MTHSADSRTMKPISLISPPGNVSAASQSYLMGIEIGDTILGRECYPDGGWNEHELMLKWRGISVCVWANRRQSSANLGWVSLPEVANWTLSDRPWVLIARRSETGDAPPASPLPWRRTTDELPKPEMPSVASKVACAVLGLLVGVGIGLLVAAIIYGHAVKN